MDFYSPITGSVRITGFFNEPRKGRPHRGIDLVPKEGPALGTPVVASASGKVVSVITNNETYGRL